MGNKENGRGAGGEKIKGRRGEAGSSKGTPGDTKSVTEILGRGIRKLGTKFKFGQLFSEK